MNKYLELRTDNYKEYIKLISIDFYNHNKLSINYELLNNDWIDIQKELYIIHNHINKCPPRLCPICGRCMRSHFPSHLESHGWTLKDYLIKFHKLLSTPKCNICGNEVPIYKYDFKITCSYECECKYLSKLKQNDPLNNFKYWDYDRLSSMNINISKELCDKHNKMFINSRVLGGTISGNSPTNPFKYWDPKTCDLSEDICNEHNKNLYCNSMTSHNRYWTPESTGYSDEICNKHNEELYKRTKETQLKNLSKLSRESSCGWHSYPEDLLGDILFKLNIHYIREYSVYINNYFKYRIDYYLPDFNTGLECDGMFKWNNNSESDYLSEYYYNRKREIQINTGIKIINIPSNKIFYYNKNKRELYKIIDRIDYPPMIIK